MKLDPQLVSTKWDEHQNKYHGRNPGLFWWQAGPEITRHQNKLISGNVEKDWLQYSLEKYYKNRLPMENCLSLGCGTGHIERKLAQLGAFAHCDAVDISSKSIEIAQQEAKKLKINTINYTVNDINKMDFEENSYDAVWINSAMHHFSNLENICENVHKCLRPDGYIFLNEYIGPNRFQFPERQKEIINLCLNLLPAQYRTKVLDHSDKEDEKVPNLRTYKWYFQRILDKWKDRQLINTFRKKYKSFWEVKLGKPFIKSTVEFPSKRDVISNDPSEAIRSEEIIDVLSQYFAIVEKKDWGGNIIQFLLADIAGNFNEDDLFSQALLRMILNMETTLIQHGELISDFAYIAASPLIRT